MELKILAIDTSNHPMSIALVEDDRLMAQTTLNMVRNHSVYVLPTIERLMDDLGWTPTDLNRVVVANGPGSYPGYPDCHHDGQGFGHDAGDRLGG